MAQIIVIKPAMPMASPDMAPSSSPIWMAEEVPMACEQVPIATPRATEFLTLKNRHIQGATMPPKIPVMIIATMVMETEPFNCLETSMPIGVVTDLASREL